MIRALALVAALAGVMPAADARGYHFRDGRGFHHWCLSSCGHRHFARHRRPRASETYSVIVTKLPPDDEEQKPSGKIPQTENSPPSPYGKLAPVRAVPVELFKPKGAR